MKKFKISYCILIGVLLNIGCKSDNKKNEGLDNEKAIVNSNKELIKFFGKNDTTSIVLLNNFFGGSSFQWDYIDKDEYFNELENFKFKDLAQTDFPLDVLNEYIEDDYIDDYRVAFIDIDNDGSNNTVVAFLDTFYENSTLIVFDSNLVTISGFPFKLNKNNSKHTFVSTPIIESTYYILFDVEFIDSSVIYDDFITIVSSNVILTNDLLKTAKDTLISGNIKIFDSPKNFKLINNCEGCSEDYGGNIMTSFSHKNLACKVFGTHIIGNGEWALVLTDKFKTSFVNECTFSESFFPFSKVLGWIRIK